MTIDGTYGGQEAGPAGWQAVGADRSIGSAIRMPSRVFVAAAAGIVVLVALAVVSEFLGSGLQGGAARGAGSVASSPGAYSLDPTRAGAARFAFDVSSGDDGSTPRGRVTFVLPTAHFSFAGTSLEGVSVRDGMVEVTGEGTVNRRGGYAFALSAEDRENGDGFRLTVWEQATNSIVYDSCQGAPRYPHVRGVPLSVGSIETSK